MTSSITVWTSGSTEHARSRVAQIIGATRVDGASYDSLSIVGCNAAQTAEKFNDAFNRLVSMTTTDATLHVLAVVPIYEGNSAAQIQTLHDACASLPHKITLHILGLASGISPIFEAHVPSESADVSSVEIIKSLCAKSTVSMSYSIIDNYAENGAPIGFTIESLSRYIAVFQTVLMLNYYQILSPALVASHSTDNIAIGVSSLSFNRIKAARQLLGLGFLEALDNVGINNTKVDAQKAAHQAELFLAGIDQRYPKLFDRSIRPLYKNSGLDHGSVAANAAPIIDADLQNLKGEILSLLKSDKLSLPEKEAVLAMILGRDNENLTGIQYKHEGKLLNDVCEQPINLYVEAFNAHCKDSHLLPVRGDFEALKKYVWNDTTERLEESPENFEAMNPLSDIKRLKQEIINSTSYIREKQEELAALQATSKQREDAEEIKRKWRKPDGAFKDIEYKEQPLDDQYSPAPGLKIKDTVDLRKFFTPVRNQSDLGSCTSFAAAAMYEAMMAQAGVEVPESMSPAYLFYYSNVLNGRPSGGSNFAEQFEVMGTHGICREELYAYDAAHPSAKPSEKAEEDALTHRVVSARQIPLVSTHDKFDTIRQNHALLTSALSEGYPIGISLKVFDNLGKDGAFILHPEDVADAKEDGWHAMVIVGYSEKNNFYIVRNSWGPEFGENGYCYIPTAYIDDPDYLSFACIITEISDKVGDARAEIPTVIANFAATESEIRMAAIRNAIALVRIDLNHQRELYTDYYEYYQRLVHHLSIPKVQNDIREAAELAQIVNYVNVDEEKRKLEDSFVAKLKSYKKSLRKSIISLALSTVIFGISWYVKPETFIFICFLVSLIAFCLTAGGYKWWKRIKRRNLQEELDQVAVQARIQAQKMLEMQIRFHVAGMWIRSFQKLTTDIGNVYDRLVSYNGTLRAWQQVYTREVAAIDAPEGQMFRTLDATPFLKSFFERNKAAIIERVDLMQLFEDYRIDPKLLDAHHAKIQDTVTSVINSLMGNFNIAGFLLGDQCPFLAAVNLADEISALINVGQPSFRNRIMNATPPVRMLFVNVPRECHNRWMTEVNPLFPMQPTQLPLSDPNTLILLTIHPQITQTEIIGNSDTP